MNKLLMRMVCRRTAVGCLGGCLLSLQLSQAAMPEATVLKPYRGPLQGPVGVTAGPHGVVYAVEPTAGRAVGFDAFGRVCVMHEGLAKPAAIAVDGQGNYYVAEADKGAVSVFDSQWKLTGQMGQGTGEFYLPNAVSVEPSGGRVYVCDSGADVINVYANTRLVLSIGGTGTGPGQFNFPAGVCLSAAGEVFVVDQGNDRVQVFNRNGQFQRFFLIGNSSEAGNRSGRSQGIAVDAAGRVYVADAYNCLVRVFDLQGNALGTVGSYGDQPGRLRSPVGLAVDGSGRLLVASANNSRIEVFGLDSFIQLSASPSSQVVAVGTDVSFSAAVSGSGPYTYQWLIGTNNLADNEKLSGATGPAVSIRSVTKLDSGEYSISVTGPTGSFTSPPAALKVIKAPAVVTGPMDLTVIAGQSAVFTVTASGDELEYQWQRSEADIPGGGASSLVIASAAPADGGRYRVCVKNRVGLATSLSATLNVVVPPAPPQIGMVAPAGDGSICLDFQCEAGFKYAVDATSDLVTWQPVTEIFSLNGQVEFQDASAGDAPVRLYRLRWVP